MLALALGSARRKNRAKSSAWILPVPKLKFYENKNNFQTSEKKSIHENVSCG